MLNGNFRDEIYMRSFGLNDCWKMWSREKVWEEDLDSIDGEQQVFWRNSEVQHYLLNILEGHYPEADTPCWVDRKKFLFEMAGKIFKQLWETLEDDMADFEEEAGERESFYMTDHLFAYTSSEIDMSDFERQIEGYREIEITKEVWNAYFGVRSIEKRLSPPMRHSTKVEPKEKIPLHSLENETPKLRNFEGESILRKLEERRPPKWYTLNTPVVRDDIYNGMKQIFPIEMANIGWNEFWDVMSLLICEGHPRGMYIHLKDLWRSPTDYAAIITNLPISTSPLELLKWLGEDTNVCEIRRFKSGWARVYFVDEKSLKSALDCNGQIMNGRLITVVNWD